MPQPNRQKDPIIQVPGQIIKVCGNVTDEYGEALIYAKIELSGSSMITETDIKGDFVLEVDTDTIETSDLKIKVSYLGHKARIIDISRDAGQWYRVSLDSEYGGSDLKVDSTMTCSDQTAKSKESRSEEKNFWQWLRKWLR